MSLERWYYFLSVEKDFIRTLDFVHLDIRNYATFSNEYAKLLILIGSEVDVVAKMVCKAVDPKKKAANIIDYKDTLVNRFKGIETIEIEVPRYGISFKPWASWDPAVSKSPAWWTAYNNVKHERDANFSDANLEHTVNSLCGWMALLLYLYYDVDHLQPYPEILQYGFPDFIVTDGGREPPGI